MALFLEAPVVPSLSGYYNNFPIALATSAQSPPFTTLFATPNIFTIYIYIHSLVHYITTKKIPFSLHPLTPPIAMAQQPALQRAHNPVKWYTWGEEAFAEARRREVPIFLLIGYSLCRGSHSMESKCFGDEEIAKLLNDSFVSIKVDRDERPDINEIYMTYADSFFGHGRWPLSVFLSPTDLKPFMCGNYLLPDDKDGNPGLKTTIRSVKKSWDKNRNILLKNAPLSARPRKLPYEDLQTALHLCAQKHSRGYDSEYGGFFHSHGSKFSKSDGLQLMLYWSKKLEETGKPQEAKEALGRVLFSLQCMAKGGIYDHVGGGFHTSSLDKCWHVPNFLKMLSDQGHIANVYINAFSITKDAFYSRVSREILDYMHSEMSGLDGVFFCAEGAVEVAEYLRYYLWTSKEIEDILGDDATLFKDHYFVKPSVNCEMIQDFIGKCKGKNVLVAVNNTAEMASKSDMPVEEYLDILGKCRGKVYHKRLARPELHKDKKIIVSWNGLAISSFARASKILKGEAEGNILIYDFPVHDNNADRYMIYAKGAASFIKRELYNDQTHRLKHSFTIDPSEVPAFLNDYAFLISGLLDMYEFGAEVKWLSWAIELQDTQDELFLDREGGGYYNTTEEHSSVVVHVKEDYCRAPGNSVSAINLIRLASFVSGSKSDCYRQNAENLLAFFWPNMLCKPIMCCAGDLLTVLTQTQKRKLVVVVGHRCTLSVEFEEMLVAAHADYEPKKIVFHIDPSDKEEMQFWERNNVLIAMIAKLNSDDDKVVAHVCENGTWHPTVSDPGLLKRDLSQKSSSSSTSTRATQ